MKEKVAEYEGEIHAYQGQEDSMNAELDNLLQINDMYRRSVEELERALCRKDLVI